MVSAAWNSCGISGGSWPASAFASAGDFNGKLRVKWLWLIICPSLVCGEGDCFSSGLLFLRRHLVRPELEGQLVDCPGELKRQRVAVVDSRPGVASDVERFVDRHENGNRVRDRLFGQFLAVDREHAGATLAGSGTIVLEIEDEGMLAWLKCAAKHIRADSATD